MARRYYIVADGERLYRETVQAISTLAQKVANRTGEAVKVHYEEADAFGRAGRTGASHRKAPSHAITARKNPASPAKLKKARRAGQAKRGFWVEWKYGTTPERKRYGNKGIATIKANELKRSGARSVRVYGA